MTSIANTLNGIEDPEKLLKNKKMSDHIQAIADKEIKRMFKGMKVLHDECADFELEEE